LHAGSSIRHNGPNVVQPFGDSLEENLRMYDEFQQMENYNSQKTPAKSINNRENPERSAAQSRGIYTAAKRGDATSPLRKNLTQHEIYSSKSK